jgi:hypothetical protein
MMDNNCNLVDLRNDLNSVLGELKWDAELASQVSLENYQHISAADIQNYIIEWVNDMKYHFNDAILDAIYIDDEYDTSPFINVQMTYLH